MLRSTMGMLVLLVLAAAVHADNWPAWRGAEQHDEPGGKNDGGKSVTAI